MLLFAVISLAIAVAPRPQNECPNVGSLTDSEVTELLVSYLNRLEIFFGDPEQNQFVNNDIEGFYVKEVYYPPVGVDNDIVYEKVAFFVESKEASGSFEERSVFFNCGQVVH